MTTSAQPKTVLDAACGSRMFWFDPGDPRALFLDKRREAHALTDKSSEGGSRVLTVSPDVLGDFTALPFADSTFALVAFDPPHFTRNGPTGWTHKKYGTLPKEWKDELRRGFAECFRVLRPEGTLVFKWNDADVALSEVLKLTPERPLFGSKYGRKHKTHWLVFMKG